MTEKRIFRLRTSIIRINIIAIWIVIVYFILISYFCMFTNLKLFNVTFSLMFLARKYVSTSTFSQSDELIANVICSSDPQPVPIYHIDST